jgi:CDP-glucose 4,6-dehydratase
MEFGHRPLESLVVNPQFWHNRKVFLTGHTGFKGSWLALWLQTLGAEVVGYSLPAPTEPNLFELAEVAREMQTVEGDVRDLKALQESLAVARPEIIFHLAAQSLVRPSYLSPVETYETNVMGTVNVLEAARQAGNVGAIVIVTSDKCYENQEWVWGYREQEPMGGYDPYSSSKGCAELVASAYRRSFFNRSNGNSADMTAIASARAGNVIGGGDWSEDRLVPDIMRAMMSGEKIVIRNPDAIRPWQHVLDPLAGYLLLAEKLCGDDATHYAEAWNFGPHEQDAKSVKWIVERLTIAWGAGASWELDGRCDNPHEAHYLKLDCSKAKMKLGWSPRWNIEQALGATAAWYKGYQAKQNIRNLTIEQINDYQASQQEVETRE